MDGMVGSTIGEGKVGIVGSTIGDGGSVIMGGSGGEGNGVGKVCKVGELGIVLEVEAFCTDVWSGTLGIRAAGLEVGE